MIMHDVDKLNFGIVLTAVHVYCILSYISRAPDPMGTSQHCSCSLILHVDMLSSCTYMALCVMHATICIRI